MARMLSRREIIDDRFGFSRILREHHGTYYLTRVQPSIQMHGYDRLLTHEVEYHTIRAPVDPATAYMGFIKESAEVEMDEYDIDIFKRQWRDASSITKLFELERALLGEIGNDEVRIFILQALAPSWFVTDTVIFHNYEEMREKAIKAAFGNNANRQKAKSVIRVYVIGKSEKFRNAELVESAAMIKMITRRWQDEEEKILAMASEACGTDVRWLVIKNVTSDNLYRFKLIPKEQKKTLKGTIDGRGPSGQKFSTIATSKGRYALLIALYDMKLDEDMDSISKKVKNRKALIKKLNELITTAKVKDEAIVDETWPDDKLNFYWQWLEGEKSDVQNNVIINMIINAAEERGWVQYK
ncbi:MAG: hypothetical protein ACMG6E_04680 [Candidatus Roizmanbacteria bacterium]